MLKRATPETALWVAFAVAFATIAGAWIFEWWGYAPCYLCLLQRWPYYAAILLLPVTAIAAGNAPWIRRPALWAFALLFAGSAVFGLYHAGVEWKWWPGPTTCGGGGQLTGLPDLTKTVVMCDEAALRIFGLSLAGWNAVISAALAAWLLRASLHSNLRSKQREKLL
jgi:disulfide bond formation protein DsbB